MAFVARRTEMLARSPDGVSNRTAWKASARNGNREALRKLQWPRYPQALAYLDEWHSEWSAGRGDAPNGLAPMTWSDVESWARQTGKVLEPYEVTALVQLDNTFRAAFRGHEEREPESDAPKVAPVAAWPQKKRET